MMDLRCLSFGVDCWWWTGWTAWRWKGRHSPSFRSGTKNCFIKKKPRPKHRASPELL